MPKSVILSMKKKKSHHSYTLNNQILEQVPSNPYLGLQIAEDLKWKEDINNTCKKKKPVPHLDSSGETYNTVLENAEQPHILLS
jgi:hypothetical protein